MALTEEQKSQNKAALGVKCRAHKARCLLLRKALAAAESAPEVMDARAAADAAAERAAAERTDRDARIDQLLAQIADLNRQIKEARDAPLKERDAERSAVNRWRELRDSKIAAAETMFPDLAGAARWSVAAWKPPQETAVANDAKVKQA